MPVTQLYKKDSSYMFTIKQLNINRLHTDNSHKRYDFSVKYTNKSFGHTFVDYLGPTYYNSMPLDLKRNYF